MILKELLALYDDGNAIITIVREDVWSLKIPRGTISISNTERCFSKRASDRVCASKAIVWIMQ